MVDIFCIHYQYLHTTAPPPPRKTFHPSELHPGRRLCHSHGAETLEHMGCPYPCRAATLTQDFILFPLLPTVGNLDSTMGRDIYSDQI